MVISIKERERESERGDNNNNVKRASTSTRGLSRTRTMGELGMGWGWGEGATWGVIGKLGGRADSPHYWGWIAFAGRSTVIRVSFTILKININLIIASTNPL